MITIDELRKYFPTEVGELEMRYEQMKSRSKSPKTIYKFRALGKVYGDSIFTRNMEDFFSDISKIVPYVTIEECLGSNKVSRYGGLFRQESRISDNFYINTSNSTNTKISLINKMCEHLGIDKKVIEHIEGGDVVM